MTAVPPPMGDVDWARAWFALVQAQLAELGGAVPMALRGTLRIVLASDDGDEVHDVVAGAPSAGGPRAVLTVEAASCQAFFNASSRPPRLQTDGDRAFVLALFRHLRERPPLGSSLSVRSPR